MFVEEIHQERNIAFSYLVGFVLLLLSSKSLTTEAFAMAFSYLVGFVLLPMVYWRWSLESPSSVVRLQQSGMLDLIRSTPLPHRTLHSGLTFPGRAPLLWNGFLLVGWNLFLLIAHLSLLEAHDRSAFGLRSRFWIPLHLGALATIPIEILSLEAAGLWWGLRTERPLKVSVILFLSYAVAPAILFVLALIAAVEAGMSSPFPVVVSWHLYRAVFSASVLHWCRSRTRRWITRGALSSPLPG